MKHLTRVLGRAWGKCGRRYNSIRGDCGLSWPAGFVHSQVSTQYTNIEDQVEQEGANGPNGQCLQVRELSGSECTFWPDIVVK